MVSFQCDACGDVVKKPKLDSHRCHSSFTCLDCSTTFSTPAEWKLHSTCITEAQKYEKGNGNPKKQAAIAPPQQGPISTGQYERRSEPARDIKPNKGRRNREITGPNVMTPSAGMRVWGSNNVSSEGSPAAEVEEPKKQSGKRKLDETEVDRAEQPKSKRTRKKSEKKVAPVEDKPVSPDPPVTVAPEPPATAAVVSIVAVDALEKTTAMNVDDSADAKAPQVDGLPVALDGKRPSRKSNKERKAEFKAKLAARSDKEKKSDKQAKKEQRQADKKERRRAKQAEKESSMTPAEKKAAKKKRKEEKAQREVEKKEKEERRVARRLRHFEKKQRKAREAQEAGTATEGAANATATN